MIENRRPAVLLVLAAALTLVGCAPDGLSGTTDDATPSAVTSTPTPTAAETPSTPSFIASGSAADNLPLFTQVVQAVWAGPDRAAGRAYVDGLVSAGFDKTQMQLTPDETTIGNPAESIEFSVRWGEDCLVGQVGPSTGDPVTTVLPGLAAGGCLLGQTRPIDW